MTERTTLVVAAALSVLLSLPPSVATAQVGHDPAHSPYRDLQRGMGLFFQTGYLSGPRGRVPVGHSNGQTFTFGYELTIGSSPTSFWTTLTYALTDRFVMDPFKDDSVRKSGPFEDDILMIDFGLRFNLTGLKTWHGLAPYISASAGLAIAGGSDVVDSSGYQFRRKLTVSPGAGLRWYVGRRMAVTLEGRALAWRLHYPPDFRRISSSDGIPVLAGNLPENEWVIHPWFRAGVGWTF